MVPSFKCIGNGHVPRHIHHLLLPNGHAVLKKYIVPFSQNDPTVLLALISPENVVDKPEHVTRPSKSSNINISPSNWEFSGIHGKGNGTILSIGILHVLGGIKVTVNLASHVSIGLVQL